MTGSTLPPPRTPGPQAANRLEEIEARRREEERRRKRRELVRHLIGLAILGGAFVWSTVQVARLAWGPSDAPVSERRIPTIRFAHWQLEGGIVQTMHDVARLYEQVQREVHGRQVRVEQIEIPERAYEQWTRTQLIGRTAPDLIEMRGDIWDNLVVRYFVPITDRIDDPNPYNTHEWDDRLARMLDQPPAPPELAGALEGVSWRDTYIDGMQGGWRNNLQDYYGMPLSVFTVRAFANRDVLEAALRWGWEQARADGRDVEDFETHAAPYLPPQDLGAMFDLCETIQAYARANDLKLVPISGSKYTQNIFQGKYFGMSTFGLVATVDRDFDGSLSDAERLAAVLEGQIRYPMNRHIEVGHRVLLDITRYFNPGFMAAQRDQSVFLFAQGYAGMIATGTWDAGSLYKEVGGKFEIMVFDFPIPAPGQKYSDVIRHRGSEAGQQTGFPFGLTKFSRDPDLAIDFMHFMTSRRVNEWLNLRFRWFPANRAAETDELLSKFRPRVEGIGGGNWAMYLSGDTENHYKGKYENYIGAHQPADQPYEAWADKHYRGFMREYTPIYFKYAPADYVRKWVNSYVAATQTEASLGQIRARVLRDGLEGNEDLRRHYVSLVLGQTRRIEDRAVGWHLFQTGLEAYDRRMAEEAAP